MLSPSRPWPACCWPPSSNPRNSPKPSRGGPNADTPSFSKGAGGGRKPAPVILLRELQATTAQLRRLTVQQNRFTLARARHDTRDWAKARRERIRHLIELGGLVQKAGLVELLDDDRATMLGAFRELAGRLQQQTGQQQGETPDGLRARWRRHGLRVFEAEREQGAVSGSRREQGQPEEGTPP